jgi:hypothetical protein
MKFLDFFWILGLVFVDRNMVPLGVALIYLLTRHPTRNAHSHYRPFIIIRICN